MLLFNWRVGGDDPSDRVDAAFARYDSAQHRAGSAGKDVQRVADAQTKRLKVDQVSIRQRTAEQQAKVHTGQTSEVVHLVDDMLRGMERQRSRDAGS
ncbi:hypothetical protein [Methylobacterium sp. WCS2018Hpa-22]|uniref:hypothetical protein n=1 Tax=Methylobacterium sp. WCS2018Hpa-22 TaxID=3073633 RepID=UPI0028897063|nr:hypothetical protein [Methylobacterium sp. WCS2018Hpa-22]